MGPKARAHRQLLVEQPPSLRTGAQTTPRMLRTDRWSLRSTEATSNSRVPSRLRLPNHCRPGRLKNGRDQEFRLPGWESEPH